MAEGLNVRNLVLTMLAETLEDGDFSHVVVNRTILKEKLEGRDRAFVSRLYLGVLERLIYLDYCINRVSSVNTVKMRPVILNILRCGAYQLMFMDSVPYHAAINESAILTKKRGFSRLVPFVNGVLRSIQRDGAGIAEENMPENVRLSVPKWIYGLTVANFGRKKAREFFEGTLEADKPLCIRLNTINVPEDEIIRSLEADGCTVFPADENGDCHYLKLSGSLTDLEAYRRGWFSVQDISSVKAALAGCRALKETGMNAPLIIDVCAAPGGKSICAAQEFPYAHIVSRDLSPAKTALIDENIKRLGITNVRSQVHDAKVTDPLMEGRADMVIADLPCSGLGVIGKKPDIKFRLRQKDLDGLVNLQREILEAVQVYVKKGGILLYSTCTVNVGENAENIKWFIKDHTFELISEEQILEGMGDGFYIAVLRKI